MATDDNTVGPLSDDEWLPRKLAVARLGITDRTLDARIKRGQLERRVSADGVVEIRVPRTTAEATVVAALALTERVGLAFAPLTERLEALARENERLTLALQAAEQERARLERALRDAERHRQPEPTVAFSWWRRWLVWP